MLKSENSLIRNSLHQIAEIAILSFYHKTPQFFAVQAGFGRYKTVHLWERECYDSISGSGVLDDKSWRAISVNYHNSYIRGDWYFRCNMNIVRLFKNNPMFIKIKFTYIVSASISANEF